MLPAGSILCGDAWQSGNKGMEEYGNPPSGDPASLPGYRIKFCSLSVREGRSICFSAAEGKWMPVMRAEASEGEKWKTDDRSPKTRKGNGWK